MEKLKKYVRTKTLQHCFTKMPTHYIPHNRCHAQAYYNKRMLYIFSLIWPAVVFVKCCWVFFFVFFCFFCVCGFFFWGGYNSFSVRLPYFYLETNQQLLSKTGHGFYGHYWLRQSKSYIIYSIGI